MNEFRICGVTEIEDVVSTYKIKKIISCLSNYKIVESSFGLTQKVMNLDPIHWKKPENWLKLNMEDITNPKGNDAPTMEEVVKGMEYGANVLRSSEPLLIHCQLGLSRSPAMAIACLLKTGSGIEEAYSKVKAVRPRIDPNELIIKLVDEHLNLNGNLIQYNNEYRAKTRRDIRGGYNELMESYLNDNKTLSVIFENLRRLDQL